MKKLSPLFYTSVYSLLLFGMWACDDNASVNNQNISDADSNTDTFSDTNTSANTDNDNNLLSTQRCENVKDLLVNCSVIGQGEVSCDMMALSACEYNCAKAQTCDVIKTAFCQDNPGATLETCFNQCTDNRFICQDEVQLNLSDVCDGFSDCTNNEDEQNCPNTGSVVDMFTCNDGQQIPKTWECDFEPDCSDNSDEHAGCASVQCS